jgi:hypothetical protein
MAPRLPKQQVPPKHAFLKVEVEVCRRREPSLLDPDS